MRCKSIGCKHNVFDGVDFCAECTDLTLPGRGLLDSLGVSKSPRIPAPPAPAGASLADRYPQYYKDVSHLSEIDVYAVHHLFNIQDPSGVIQHASKKLLLSGVRTGGKSFYDDVREARDSLNRWLELNAEDKTRAEALA
jgi:hypothetical protein